MYAPFPLVSAGDTQLLDVVTTRLSPDVAVVEVRGEVDASNTMMVHDAALRLPPAAFIVDLTDVNFFCSSGITTLMFLNRQCSAADVRLRLVAPRAVHRVLELVGLGDLFTLFGSRAQAVAEFART